MDDCVPRIVFVLGMDFIMYWRKGAKLTIPLLLADPIPVTVLGETVKTHGHEDFQLVQSSGGVQFWAPISRLAGDKKDLIHWNGK